MSSNEQTISGLISSSASSASTSAAGPAAATTSVSASSNNAVPASLVPGRSHVDQNRPRSGKDEALTSDDEDSEDCPRDTTSSRRVFCVSSSSTNPPEIETSPRSASRPKTPVDWTYIGLDNKKVAIGVYTYEVLRSIQRGDEKVQYLSTIEVDLGTHTEQVAVVFLGLANRPIGRIKNKAQHIRVLGMNPIEPDAELLELMVGQIKQVLVATVSPEDDFKWHPLAQTKFEAFRQSRNHSTPWSAPTRPKRERQPPVRLEMKTSPSSKAANKRKPSTAAKRQKSTAQTRRSPASTSNQTIAGPNRERSVDSRDHAVSQGYVGSRHFEDTIMPVHPPAPHPLLPNPVPPLYQLEAMVREQVQRASATIIAEMKEEMKALSDMSRRSASFVDSGARQPSEVPHHPLNATMPPSYANLSTDRLVPQEPARVFSVDRLTPQELARIYSTASAESFASPPPMFPPSAVYRVPPASALYRASQIETIEILERAMQRQSELTERLLRRHMY